MNYIKEKKKNSEVIKSKDYSLLIIGIYIFVLTLIWLIW